jgi:hypothetical protein
VELVGPDSARAKAFGLLQRDHIRSEKLGPVCERVSSGFARDYETFLRAVLAENPHRVVRAHACLALAHFLTARVQRLELIKDRQSLAREFADLYGKDYLAELQRHGRAEAMHEAVPSSSVPCGIMAT